MNLGPLTLPSVLGRVLFTLMFNVVNEKAQNFKEYLRVNGASLYSYIMSMVIFYFARAVLAMTLMYIGVIFFFSSSTETILVAIS